jgi:hypothetical protein
MRREHTRIERIWDLKLSSSSARKSIDCRSGRVESKWQTWAEVLRKSKPAPVNRQPSSSPERTARHKCVKDLSMFTDREVVECVISEDTARWVISQGSWHLKAAD